MHGKSHTYVHATTSLAVRLENTASSSTSARKARQQVAQRRGQGRPINLEVEHHASLQSRACCPPCLPRYSDGAGKPHSTPRCACEAGGWPNCRGGRRHVPQPTRGIYAAPRPLHAQHAGRVLPASASAACAPSSPSTPGRAWPRICLGCHVQCAQPASLPCW